MSVHQKSILNMSFDKVMNAMMIICPKKDSHELPFIFQFETEKYTPPFKKKFVPPEKWNIYLTRV